VQLAKVEFKEVMVHPLGIVTLERAVHELKATDKLIVAAVVVGKVISCRFEQPENENDDRLLIEVVGKLTLVNP
jgi:phosphoribosylformylglycinamidine (FGAM) synthase PurS component